MTSADRQMSEYGVSLWGKALCVRYPTRWQAIIEKAFAVFPTAPGKGAQILLEVGEKPDGRVTIDRTGIKNEKVHMELDAVNLPACLIEAATNAWARAFDAGAVLKAHAVDWRGQAVIVAGLDEAGKTAMAEFLQDKGAGYLSDSMVAIDAARKTVRGVPSDMAAADVARRSADLSPVTEAVPSSGGTAAPASGLIIFPQLVRDGKLDIETLSTAAAGQRLMQSLKNGSSLPRDGLSVVADIARSVRAVAVSYGDVWQLLEVADRIEDLLQVEQTAPPSKAAEASETRRSASGMADEQPRVQAAQLTEREIASARQESAPPKITEAALGFVDARLDADSAKNAGSPAKAAEAKSGNIALTIGMATYDDYDGVYFTIQALRLYHPEVADHVEFIVVDNNPDGPCGEALKSLEAWIPNYRYVPEPLRTGTSQSRNRVFEEAKGEFVLCMDCHVFIFPGALKRLLDYFAQNPRSSDLLQGPLVMDDLKSLSTHFKPQWGGGMYGQWDTDPRGVNPDAPPFDIPMQGLGLFVCRRDAWLGFNSEFRGFGGEEGYIHEKFRQNGRRALCLPFLRWLHRFQRPMGIPYPAPWEDRIRNYMIGYRELGLSSEAMEAHFREFLGADQAHTIFGQLMLVETA